MNNKLFGDDVEPISTKTIFWVFTLALMFRLGILAINGYWDHPPGWGFLPRTGLTVAWSNFGTLPLPENFESTFNISLAGALSTWHLNDRGLIMLYVLIHKIVGQVTYLHIQLFHLTMDAMMVAPVMWLANRIADKRGAILAGAAYALFLPQAQMAVSPDYNAWLGCSTLFMTWIAAMLSDSRQRSNFAILLGLMIVSNFISTEFRSVVAMFAFGAAGWLWLINVGVHRTLFPPAFRWKAISALVLAGVAVMFFSASTNFLMRGDYSPVRSSLGHNFFTGVGQYANPLGMRDDDAAPAEWYTKETGIEDTNNGMDPAYNAWLNERAKVFIAEYPVLYASMVARRALRILFPNMAFTVVTNLPSYYSTPHQKELRKIRKTLVEKHGWVSMTTMITLLKNDPAYIFGLGWRVLLLLALPIGIFSAIWLARSRAMATFAMLPLAYGVITLSFVYVTPPVVTGIHAAVLAVSASGLYLLALRLKILFARLPGRGHA